MMPVGPNGEPLPYPEDLMGAGPMMGAPPQDAPPSEDEAIAAALEAIRAAISAADDDVTRLALEKASTLVQQIRADAQKEQQNALQGKMSPRLTSKAYGP